MYKASTFVTVCLLLVYVLLLEGCTRIKNKRKATLHNYPVIKGQECPITVNNYDEEFVKERAAALGIRPVDYLHRYNNMRYKPVNKNRNVGFTNDNREK